MSEEGHQPSNQHDDLLIQQLARLDGDVQSEADSTVKALKSELETMAAELRQPPPDNPFQDESACRRANELVQAIGREPSFVAEQASSTDLERPELGELGQYRLLEKLGEGGMGAVYKALHTSLKRLVALKVLPAERMKDEQAVNRFRREMEAVGKLDHPNIVRATDAGQVDDTHYLVMELVEGVDLSTLVRRVGPLGPAAACELIRQAAVGLQEAHEHGMVHRDIKPSNIMLARTRRGTKPPTVKVLDLGLALLDEKNSAERRELTSTGQMMGTLDYMAPEQGSDSHEVDIRADIYSLGATLYKLLCGESPFPSSKYDTPVKMIMALATEAAPSIAAKRNDLPPELVTIVDRMLAKSPDDRYATPQKVADALAPFAEGADLAALLESVAGSLREPEVDQSAVATHESLKSGSVETDATIDMQSSPHTLQEEVEAQASVPGGELHSTPAIQAQGWWSNRRNLTVAAATALAGVILLGVILTFTFKDGTVVVATPGDELPEDLKVVLSGGDKPIVITAENKWKVSVGPGDYQISVEGGDDKFDIMKERVSVSRFGRTLITIEYKKNVAVASRVERPAESPPQAEDAPSPFDKYRHDDVDPHGLAMAGGGALEKAPKELAFVFGDSRLNSPTGTNAVAWNPAGKELASPVMTWDAETGQLKRVMVPDGYSRDLAYRADGRQLASVSASGDGGVHLWDPQTGEELRKFDSHDRQKVYCVAYSPDGKQIASGAHDGRLIIWSPETGDVSHSIQARTDGALFGVAFSPDGKMVAVCGPGTKDGTPRAFLAVYNATNGELLRAIDIGTEQQSLAVSRIAFTPAGKLVATVGHEIHVYDVGTGDNELTLRGEGANGPFTSVDVGHNGRRIAACTYGAQVFVWDAESGKQLLNTQCVGSGKSVKFSPDGSRLAYAGLEGGILVLDAETGREVVDRAPTHIGPVRDLAISQDGTQLVSVNTYGQVHIRDTETGELTFEHEAGNGYAWLDCDADASVIAVSGGAGIPIIIDRSAEKPLRRLANAICYLPSVRSDGKRAAGGSTENTVRIWDTKTGEELLKFTGHKAPVTGVKYSPDGKRVASASSDGKLYLWDAESGEIEYSLSSTVSPEGRQYADQIAFSADGRRLMVTTGARELTIYETSTGRPVCITETRSSATGMTAALSPDGQLLTELGENPSFLLIRDAESGEVLREIQLTFVRNHYITSMVFAPDGRHILAGTGNGLVYVIRLEEPPGGAAFPSAHDPPTKLADKTIVMPYGWHITPPVNLGPTINSEGYDSLPCLSADGLTLLFQSDRPGGRGSHDIWQSTRDDISKPFDKPVNLGSLVNTTESDGHPHLSADELTLLLVSSRPGGHGSHDLWMSRRVSTEQPFGPPANLGPMVNSEASDGWPCLSFDGLTLIFASDREGGEGEIDLWMSTRADVSKPFGKPSNLGPRVNSKTQDSSPCLSADALTLLFVSSRKVSGQSYHHDLWMCRRTSTEESFGEPVNLGPPINRVGVFSEDGPYLSADGRTLLFSAHNRPDGQGDHDLYQVTIVKSEVPKGTVTNTLGDAVVKSPFDQLRREDIAAHELVMAGGEDAPKELVAVLGESRMKHFQPIHALRFSNDGQSLISSGADGTRVWDLQTFQQGRHVSAMQFSPDGTRYARLRSGNVALHDSASGQVLRQWTGLAVWPRMLAFSHEGDVLAFANTERLYICDATNGNQRHAIELGEDVSATHSDVAIRHDGAMAAVATGKEVHVFNTKTGGTLWSHVHGVFWPTLLFSPDGSLLASMQTHGQGAARIVLHDAATGKERGRLEDRLGRFFGLTFDKTAKRLAISKHGGFVEIWDVSNEPKQLDRFQCPDTRANIAHLAFSPDGEFLATSEHDSSMRALRVWRLKDHAEVGPGLDKPATHDSSLGGEQWPLVMPDGKRAIIGTVGGRLEYWDMTAQPPRRESVIQPPTAVSHVSPRLDRSPDGKLLATGPAHGANAAVWNVESGERLFILPKGAAHPTFLDNDRVATAQATEVTIWNAKKGEKIKALQIPVKGDIGNLATSPDGTQIAVDHRAELVAVDLKSGEPLFQRDDHGSGMIKYSPNGNLLVGSGYDWLDVRDASTGQSVAHVEVPAGGYHVFDFNPDGSSLAAFNHAGVLTIANPRSGVITKQIRLPEHTKNTSRLTYAPDGRHLLVTLPNGTVNVLRLEELSVGRLSKAVQDGSGDPSYGKPNEANVARSDTATLPKPVELDFEPLPPHVEPGQPLNQKTFASAPAKIDGLASWTVESRKPRFSVGCRFSPDGKTLAAMGADRVVRLFDSQTRELKRMIIAPSEHNFHYAPFDWSADGTMIATGGDEALWIWEANSGRLLKTLLVEGTVTSLDWNPDNRLLAAGWGDTVSVWDLQKDELLHDLKPKTASYSVSWSPNGKYLAVGHQRWAIPDAATMSHDITIWDAATGMPVRRIAGKKGGIQSAGQWSPDSTKLVCYQSGGKSRILDLATGKVSVTLDDEYSHIEWLPGGKKIIGCIWNKTAKTLDATTGQVVDGPPIGNAAGAWMHPNGELLVTSSTHGQIHFWRLDDGERDATIPTIGQGIGGHWVYIYMHLSESKTATPHDGVMWTYLKNVEEHAEWTADGRLVARMDADDKRIHLEEPESRQKRVLAAHTGGIYRLKFSDRGEYLASLGNDGLRIWDTTMAKEVLFLDKEESPVHLFTWKPDGKRIITSEGDAVVVRDVPSGDIVQTLNFRGFGVGAIDASPDGTTLAIGGSREIEFWDMSTWKKTRQSLPTASFAGTGLVWMRDSRRITVRPDWTTLVVYDSQSGEALHRFEKGNNGMLVNREGTAVSLVENPGTMFVTEILTNRKFVLHNLNHERSLGVSPEGHFQCSPGVEDELVYIALTEDGWQEFYTPAEFEKKYGWKNDPKQVRWPGESADE